jgi:AraC-like DNA-binding protein
MASARRCGRADILDWGELWRSVSLSRIAAQVPCSTAGTGVLAENFSDGGRRLLESFLERGGLPLRAALEAVQLSGWISPVATLDEPWALAVRRGHHSFFGLVKGQCCLDVGDIAPIVALRAGDFVIAKEGAAGTLFDQSEELIGTDDSQMVLDQTACSAIESQIISGGFVPLDGGAASFLAAFPPVFVVQGNGGRFVGWVDKLLELLLDESPVDHPVASDVVNRLLGVLFIKVVRYALEQCQPGAQDLFNASVDPDVGVVLARIHERPGHPWTVAGLAREAGLCRSTFAARFQLAVGKPPLHYLRDVRMQRSAVLLRERAHSLKEIALMCGYCTTSAFSAAFRRWAGKSPGEYRDFAAEDVKR